MPSNHNQLFTISCRATITDLHLMCNHYTLNESGVILYDNANEWIGYVPLHSLIVITKTDHEY